MKWLDSRVHKPSCSRYTQYIVCFLNFSDVTTVGLAEWIPKDAYTDGDWGQVTHTNGNKTAGKVLYWMQWPKETALEFN